MKKKLVGMVILMLVATTVVSATNIIVNENTQTIEFGNTPHNHNKITPSEPTLFIFGVDQKNTKDCGYGVLLFPPFQYAQSFTPKKDKLTAVSLYLSNYRYYSQNPILINVSIRDSLNGSDLTATTLSVNKDTITNHTSKWIVFDFPDIIVTPGKQYFIICSGNAGDNTACYLWVYNDDDTYTGGEAWGKDTIWSTWPPGDLSPADFCFVTYFRKPLDVPVSTNYETLVNPLTHVNMKEKINPLSTSVDVPVWKKGDLWTYDVHSQCYTYDTNGTIYSTCLTNATEIWTVTAVDNDNYTVQRISKNISGIFFYGPYRWIFTKYMKLTEDDILQKTNLAQIQFTSVFKGLVRWLIGKHNFSIPAQFTVSTLNINSPPDILIPFPLTAGTNGTLPNVHTTGYQKCTLYWGLIKAYNLPNLSGYTGIRKYTCKMENITVPADTYNSYNISVTYSTHNYWRSYYVPDIGNFAKRSVNILWGNTFNPYLIQEWDLVSTTYTP